MKKTEVRTDLPMDHVSLFQAHTSLRAVIDACLEGRAGAIRAAGERPAALRLDVGCYAVFGGDADSDEAQHLIERVPPGRELVYVGPGWQQRIHAVFPAAVDASMKTFLPGPGYLETAQRHVADLHPDYRIRALSPEDRPPDHLKPNGFQVHANTAAFFVHGFGLVATLGGLIVAQTTTYTASSHKAEIAIATDPGHRNKGLATSLAAAMLLECARRGLEPHWSASNPVSQRLARRIGLVDGDDCRVLVVRKPA